MDLTNDVEDYKLNVRAAVVITHKGKILVHKNLNSDHYALIGGRVEIGEDSETTVKRDKLEDIGKEIEVTGYEDLKDGENIITVIVKEKDTDKTATYQITVNKISNEQNITDTAINKMQLSQNKIIVICAGVAVILLIIILTCVGILVYRSHIDKKEVVETNNEINEPVEEEKKVLIYSGCDRPIAVMIDNH